MALPQNVPVKTITVMLSLAVATVLSVTVPIPGKPLLPPRHVTLVTEQGQATPTSVAVMLVSTREDPPALWRAVGSAESLWNDLAVSPGWGFDGRAGDIHQEEARASAWYVAQRELGNRVGLKLISGDLPEGLQRGDVIMGVGDGDDSRGYLTEALRSMQAAARVQVQHGLRNSRLSKAHLDAPLPLEERADSRSGSDPLLERTSILVQRGSEEVVIPVEDPSLGPSVRAEEWTALANPYTVPSLTGVTGSSAGLALALAYLEGLTGAHLAGEPVAVTGALWTRMDGGAGVGAISGLRDKIEASLASGYTTLVVPLAQYDETTAIVGDRPATILGVRTLEAAVGALCARGGSCASLPRHLLVHREGDLAVHLPGP